MSSSWHPADEPGRAWERESGSRRERLPIPYNVTEKLDSATWNHLRLLQRYEKVILEHLLDVDHGAQRMIRSASGAIKNSLDSSKKKEFNRLQLVVKIINSLSRGKCRQDLVFLFFLLGLGRPVSAPSRRGANSLNLPTGKISLPQPIAFRKYVYCRSNLLAAINTPNIVEFARELHRLFPMSATLGTQHNDDRFYILLRNNRVPLPADAVLLSASTRLSVKRSLSDISSPAPLPASQRVRTCGLGSPVTIKQEAPMLLVSSKSYYSGHALSSESPLACPSRDSYREAKKNPVAPVALLPREASRDVSGFGAIASSCPSLVLQPPSSAHSRALDQPISHGELLEQYATRIRMLELQNAAARATNAKLEHETIMLERRLSVKEAEVNKLEARWRTVFTELQTQRQQMQVDEEARSADQAQRDEEKKQLARDQNSLRAERLLRGIAERKLEAERLRLGTAQREFFIERRHLDEDLTKLAREKAAMAAVAAAAAATTT